MCSHRGDVHLCCRSDHLDRFYDLITELIRRTGGPRRVSECTGRLEWPRRGVYFLFEDGELRSESGDFRVVRVGTHALKTDSRTTLWNRLSQHRGSKSSGRGNHRGSIFRLLVGAALAKRYDLEHPSWGVGSSAPREIRMAEAELEKRVSRTIGAMRVAWLPIDDEPGPSSMRGRIERNSIALLSNAGRATIDPPSSTWLGHYCPRPLVGRSGLWNQNHVDEAPEPVFLDQLEAHVLNAEPS